MFCCQVETVSSAQRIEYQETPLKFKLIQSLGLSNFAINHFVFARPKANYSAEESEGESRLLIEGEPYTAPYGYTYEYTLLANASHSIPVVRLKLAQGPARSTIIYSHGNCSTLALSLKFVSSLAEFHRADYIVYDYTGYGASKVKETTPQSIWEDLEMVIAWSQCPLESLVLVGFSLGCFPTGKVAAKHRVQSVVLLAPMASLISLFQEKLTPFTFFRSDQFSLLQVVENIESHLLIAHSRHDQIIPFRHSEVLYQRYLQISRNTSVELLELKDIGHNQMHMHLTSTHANAFKTRFLRFLQQAETEQPVPHHIYHRKKEEGMMKSRDLKDLLKRESKARQKEQQTASQNHFTRLRNQLLSPPRPKQQQQ